VRHTFSTGSYGERAGGMVDDGPGGVVGQVDAPVSEPVGGWEFRGVPGTPYITISFPDPSVVPNYVWCPNTVRHGCCYAGMSDGRASRKPRKIFSSLKPLMPLNF
jgi:hypothetical protein